MDWERIKRRIFEVLQDWGLAPSEPEPAPVPARVRRPRR